jgi:two-component system nitrogen regulation response regulator GlnG
LADLPPELKEDATKSNSAVSWQDALADEVFNSLVRGEQNVLETYTQQFEKTLITQGLKHTNGRRIEAANQLGMGRNTLTRKIQDLGIED